jgi:DNA-binding beta-propeller fold protein YncE
VRGRDERLAQYRFGFSMRIVLFLATAAACAAQGLLFVGTWPKQVQVIDEAKQKVIDHIELQTGTPRSLSLSEDRKTLYVTTTDHNGIEVVDVATRKVTNSFVLDEGEKRVRFNAFAADPGGKLIYMVIRISEKKKDRFEIEKQKFAIVDLEQKKIVRTADIPPEEEARGGFGFMKISPDGKFMYLFRGTVLIFDTTDFKLVETIDLSKPQFPGMAQVGMGGSLDSIQEPGTLVSLFNSSDPIVRRSIFGIARFDLTRRSFQFTPIGPSTGGMMGLHVTPDRKTGYTVSFSGQGGNRRSEFWVFDLNSNQLARKQEFDGRSRFNFGISSNGKDMYIYGAGYTVEVFDANSLKLRNTIDLNADITTGMVVLPQAR